MIKQLFALTIGLMLSVAAIAQQVGYVNTAELLTGLPEVKSAQTELESMQASLEQQSETMLIKLQEKYIALQKKQESGDISPKELEAQSKNLEAEKQKISEFNDKSIRDLKAKEDALLNPIQDKINTAIQSVAKDKGLQYVFDTSSGIILYAEEGLDITADVKTKVATM